MDAWEDLLEGLLFDNASKVAEAMLRLITYGETAQDIHRFLLKNGWHVHG